MQPGYEIEVFTYSLGPIPTDSSHKIGSKQPERPRDNEHHIALRPGRTPD